MTRLSPYHYSFDPAGDSTAAMVCRSVGFEKDVLELGCANGVMTKVLQEHFRCRVFGVEYDAVAAERARPYCTDLRVADLEGVDWHELLGDRRFDVIVAADVLEHLGDPLACLRNARDYLKPGGYFVLSVPNVAHNGIVAELFREDFEYRRTGLLDDTHRRLFGYESILRLVEAAGLVTQRIEASRMAPAQSEFGEKWQSLPLWLATLLSTRPLGDVYQFVLTAAPAAWAVRGQESDNLDANWQPYPGVVEGALSEEWSRTQAALDEALKQAAAMTERMEAAERARELTALNLQSVLNSRSWRVTRPLRLLVRTLRHGLQDEDARRLFQLLRTAYRRLPIPAGTRRKLSGFLRRLVARRLRRAMGAWVPPDSSIRLADALPGKRDYVVFGVIDWHFRHQRPQQLALELAARGNRVFYVSVNFVDSDEPGFALEPLDDEGRLFSLRLHLKGAPLLYDAPPGVQESAQLREGVGLLLAWADIHSLVAMVQYPYWSGVAAALPNGRLVYDCMDHHEGFGGVSAAMLAQERTLLGACDLTVTTSEWIDNVVAGKTRRSVVVRNGTDFDHFAQVPQDVYRDPEGRRIIGYYGAIAEWFDIGLVAAVAEAFPRCAIVLIGADTVDARRRLARYRNVTFLGEVAYRDLPRYAHAFDVCLLPFKVVPLTLATNPVKVYEYLSMGKPVVSVDLPEVRRLGGLCAVASDHAAFVSAVKQSLEQASPEQVQARREFARTQTWAQRADVLAAAAEATDDEPPVSVVVVTYNNLDLTKQCLSSIERYSDYPNLEIIVVDNASADGSQDWLREWVGQGEGRRLILNDANLGFAAANNQGLRAAKGEYLVMLNNDTHVTPGWVRTLVNHMRRDPGLGLLGPVTNNIGNEARIEIAYDGMDQMMIRAAEYTRRRMGKTFALRTAAFFCVMLRRETFDKIGPLDEAFGRGFFEDDDYCRRVEQAGLRVACAEDVFIHHHLSASFNKLKHKERQALFEENKRIYEQKWGTWIPHSYREGE